VVGVPVSALPLVTLGIALGDVDHGVIEEGGPNAGPRVRAYLRHCDPPLNVAAPWCAAFVQYVSDVAAEALDIYNPLNGVKLEAYVQSYHEWAKAHARIVDVAQAQSGDLILYSFGGKRWDHVGIVLRALSGGKIAAVEGNTSPGVGASAVEREREGDGVYIKVRTIGRQDIEIVRWA
jgi:hypothetical protein